MSVFRITPVSHDVFIRGSFSGTILKAAGLARPSSQDLDASAGRRLEHWSSSAQTLVEPKLN